jgi:hypothetical protein
MVNTKILTERLKMNNKALLATAISAAVVIGGSVSAGASTPHQRIYLSKTATTCTVALRDWNTNSEYTLWVDGRETFPAHVFSGHTTVTVKLGVEVDVYDYHAQVSKAASPTCTLL